MDVNVKSQYLFSVEVVKAMKERFPNTKNLNMSILLIASVAGIRLVLIGLDYLGSVYPVS